MIGRSLGHYRITAAIGAGGMGEVYRATDSKLGREVAKTGPARALTEDLAEIVEIGIRRPVHGLQPVPLGVAEAAARADAEPPFALSEADV